MSRSASGERVVGWILAHSRRVLAIGGLCLLLAGLVCLQAVSRHGRLPVDNSLEMWFLEEDEALVRYLSFLEQWGNDEAVVISFSDPHGILRPETLNLIDELSERLQAIPQVHRVTSLATVSPLTTGEDGEVVSSRYFESPVEAHHMPAVRKRIAEDTLFRQQLLASDELATALSVQLYTSPQFDKQRDAILDRVQATVRETLRQGGRDPDDWAWGGIGVIHSALNRIVVHDTPTFMAWTILLLVIGLFLAFRRLLAIVACMLSVALATLLLMGIYLSTGLSLNMVTMVLPTLVMVVGLTDAVYFLMTFQRQCLLEPKLPSREAVVRALGFCFWPGLFNSVTTSIGFLAFLSARMAVIRHLGVFAGAGIVLAFVTSLIVCTLFAARWPQLFSRPQGGVGLRERVLNWLAGAVARRRRLILGSALLAFVWAIGGICRIQVDSFALGYFYDSHPIRRQDRQILESIGPYIPLELVVRTAEQNGIKDPAVLEGIYQLGERVIEREDGVGSAISLAAVTRRLNQVLSGDEQAGIPADRDLLEQELLFYDPDDPDDPAYLVDAPAWKDTRLTLRIRNEGARAAKELLGRIHEDAAELLPPQARLESGGYMPLYVRLIEHLVWGQVTSIAITVGVIFFVIAALFRSWRYALLSIPPNLLPVALTLGLMGYLGIRLDVGTVLVAAVALGIAVDDTIHFLYKFRAELDDTRDRQQALQSTLVSAGRAIASTSLIVTAGFSALCFATVKTVALFGLLLGITMLTALVAELVVTPAMVLSWSKPSQTNDP